MGEKILLFTFDYELFLGRRSGSVEKCLIEPTKRLLDIFDTYHISSAIFFIDTTYLIRLKEIVDHNEDARRDWDKIRNQLTEIIQKGHYIFPHLHPHWLDAVYDANDNQWKLADLSKYRFNNLSDTDKAEVFDQSMKILNEISFPVDSSYSIDGYRAGGWSLQPFETFLPYFDKHRIKYDFSVLPGKHQFTTAQFYDYRKVPDKAIYRFGKQVEDEDEIGNFTEIAITSLRYPLLTQKMDRYWQKILWKMNNRSVGDGHGVISQPLQGYEVSDNQENNNLERASIELLNRATWPVYKRYIAKNNYIQFISHPKMLSRHNFHMLEKMLSWVTQTYSIETDFKKVLEV